MQSYGAPWAEYIGPACSSASGGAVGGCAVAPDSGVAETDCVPGGDIGGDWILAPVPQLRSNISTRCRTLHQVLLQIKSHHPHSLEPHSRD